MEELVHVYLTKNYIIEDNLGYDIMCKHDGYRKKYLASELATIFSISEEDAKLYTNKWAVNLIPDVDLNLYWCTSASRSGHLGFSQFRRPGIYVNETDNCSLLTNGVVS